MPPPSGPGPGPLHADARDAVLAWFEANGRHLPFRGISDPYAILVSEAIAQQTQIARAGERWVRFLDRFPTVNALAAATPADVLREWRGLGYNRRALNLWRAARVIVDEHGGRVPDDLEALQRLPGVGPYTARAVAAFAFARAVGPVDTNVARVLARSLGAGASRRELQRIADESVPAGRSRAWGHALMDVGATICRPKSPRCGSCPLEPWCRYRRLGPPRPVPARRGHPAFPRTSRWLRGRILDQLRDARHDGWVRFDAPIGAHDLVAVGSALAALERDGLLERDGRDPSTCRLPVA